LILLVILYLFDFIGFLWMFKGGHQAVMPVS